ncbi:unnamed protein product, partial [Discosporangium mesarthrocarpum]
MQMEHHVVGGGGDAEGLFLGRVEEVTAFSPSALDEPPPALTWSPDHRRAHGGPEHGGGTPWKRGGAGLGRKRLGLDEKGVGRRREGSGANRGADVKGPGHGSLDKKGLFSTKARAMEGRRWERGGEEKGEEQEGYLACSSSVTVQHGEGECKGLERGEKLVRSSSCIVSQSAERLEGEKGKGKGGEALNKPSPCSAVAPQGVKGQEDREKGGPLSYTSSVVNARKMWESRVGHTSTPSKGSSRP